MFRPSIKELLAKDFFAEDTGFKVELAQREELVKSDKNDVNFRLRYDCQFNRNPVRMFSVRTIILLVKL